MRLQQLSEYWIQALTMAKLSVAVMFRSLLTDFLFRAKLVFLKFDTHLLMVLLLKTEALTSTKANRKRNTRFRIWVNHRF